MSTSVLLIPHHPAKAANVLILARKLAALAQEQGLRAEVAALSDAAAGDFSRIVFVGQLPEQHVADHLQRQAGVERKRYQRRPVVICRCGGRPRRSRRIVCR